MLFRSIAMSKTLSLTVVAEGVETQEQMDFLTEHACDEMQGYLFNRPVPPEQFADLMRQHLPAHHDPKEAMNQTSVRNSSVISGSN